MNHVENLALVNGKPSSFIKNFLKYWSDDSDRSIKGFVIWWVSYNDIWDVGFNMLERVCENIFNGNYYQALEPFLSSLELDSLLYDFDETNYTISDVLEKLEAMGY